MRLLFYILCGLTDLDIAMEVKCVSELRKTLFQFAMSDPSRSCCVDDFGTMTCAEYVTRATLGSLYDPDQPEMFAGQVPQEKWLDIGEILPIVVSCFDLNVMGYTFGDVSEEPEMTWLAKSERGGKPSFQHEPGFKSAGDMMEGFHGPVIYMAYSCTHSHFWYLRLGHVMPCSI